MKDLSCKGCEMNGLWGLSCTAGIRSKLKAKLKELHIILEKKKLDPDLGAEEIRIRFEIKNILKNGGKCKEMVD